MRLKAQNERGTHAYYMEPYTVQHFTDFIRDRAHMVFVEIPGLVWYMLHSLISEKHRMEEARAYNQLMFGNIPTSQIYVQDHGVVRPLREEERTWPE
jgi:hypothetical protein